jgi:hypothetical protein
MKFILRTAGDRNKKNIPEMKVSDINFIFSVGGDDKKNSSSWILNKWQYYFEERQWGSFFNLFETKNIKVKELIIEPGKAMSFQKHLKRNEIWLVSEGSCEVNSAISDPEQELKKLYLINLITILCQLSNGIKYAIHLINSSYY